MDSVQEAFDNAEGDKAADVDVCKQAAVLRVPLLDALALFEACVEFYQGGAVDNRWFVDGCCV
jgi:hypothetical protein